MISTSVSGSLRIRAALQCSPGLYHATRTSIGTEISVAHAGYRPRATKRNRTGITRLLGAEWFPFSVCRRSFDAWCAGQGHDPRYVGVGDVATVEFFLHPASDATHFLEKSTARRVHCRAGARELCSSRGAERQMAHPLVGRERNPSQRGVPRSQDPAAGASKSGRPRQRMSGKGGALLGSPIAVPRIRKPRVRLCQDDRDSCRVFQTKRSAASTASANKIPMNQR